MAEARILAVDDEYLIRWTLQQNLTKEGYEVILAESGEEALVKVKEEAPDVERLGEVRIGHDRVYFRRPREPRGRVEPFELARVRVAPHCQRRERGR